MGEGASAGSVLATQAGLIFLSAATATTLALYSRKHKAGRGCWVWRWDPVPCRRIYRIEFQNRIARMYVAEFRGAGAACDALKSNRPA